MPLSEHMRRQLLQAAEAGEELPDVTKVAMVITPRPPTVTIQNKVVGFVQAVQTI